MCSELLPWKSWRVMPLVVWCLDFRGLVSIYKNKPINKKGSINQSRNFPLLRLRRHNEPEEGCGTLPGIVGFLEMILSIIDPLTIHNNVTLKLYFYLHVQLWFEFSLVVSHWWATMCASSKNPSIHKYHWESKACAGGSVCLCLSHRHHAKPWGAKLLARHSIA